MRTLIAVVAAALASGSAASDSLAHIEDAIRCLTPPEPAELVLDLREDRLLGESVGPTPTEARCWQIIDGLFWKGAEFNALCAVVDDERVAYRFDDLFGADGLSAVDAIWLQTRMPPDRLVDWVARSIAGGRVAVEATVDGASLTCSSWSFPVDALTGSI